LTPPPVRPAISRRYIAGMSEPLRFVPPGVDFDPQLANELARLEAGTSLVDGEAHPIIDRRSPFNFYVRMLTPEGGILICYKDQHRSLLLTTLRIAAWIVAAWIEGRLIFFESSLSAVQCIFACALLMLVNGLIVRRRIIVSHSVEIRPDTMIIDGKHVFYADEIGENWPALQMKDDDPDRMVICGICGTRFIEYMTANRLDKNDRTPEILAADLQAAMEQLWGRREVTFPTTL